jgi:predicted nuclease of predicted toxin-antitoxin system
MMKLLLNESIPKKLAGSFPSSFDVRAVQQLGWAGVNNGELEAC